MGAATRVDQITPNSVFIGALAASFLVFVFSIVSVLGLSWRQNEQLVHYELTILLRSHGESIRTNRFREFIQTANLDSEPLSLSIKNTVDSSHFEFAGVALGRFQQCSSEEYFQYDVTLCRTRLVPWSFVGLIAGLYVLILSLAFWVLLRVNREMVGAFRRLFQTADLPYPEPLTFSGGWRFALEMAERFKAFQVQSIEFGRAQAIARIASKLAHDIRSPLSVLNMLSVGLTEVSQEKRDMMKMVSKRINDIANDLLQKRSAGAVGTQVMTAINDERLPEMTDFGELVQAIVSEKRLEFSGRPELRLEYSEGDKGPSKVRLFKGNVSRAFSNLINNAVEAMGPSGGDIQIGLNIRAEQYLLTIEDNGKGMSEETLAKLGEEGFTYGKSESTSGSGLGFFQASQAVVESGGSIDVKSSLGQGTTVMIRFPRLP